MASNPNLNELPASSELVAAEYNRRAQNFLTEAKAFEIDSQTMAEMAVNDLKKIKAYANDVEEKRKTLTKPLDDVKKGIMDLFRPATDYLVKAETTLKLGIKQYLDAEEKKRRELEDAARKVAREQAAKLEAEAKVAAEQGRAEQARELEQQAAMVPATVMVSAPAPRFSGVTSTKVYKFEVTDKLALIKAVAEGKIPMAALDVNEMFIRNQLRALKGEFKCPGVRIFNDTQIGARAS